MPQQEKSALWTCSVSRPADDCVTDFFTKRKRNHSMGKNPRANNARNGVAVVGLMSDAHRAVVLSGSTFEVEKKH